MRHRSILHLSASLSLIALFSVAVPLIAQTPAAPVKTYPSFVTVVERDFAKWDSDRDGTLEPEEIDHAVLSSEITGDDAAAAATLKLAIRGAKVALPPLTKQYFLDYEKTVKRRPTTGGSNVSVGDALRNGRSRNEASTKPDAQRTPATQPADSTNPNWELIYRASRHRIQGGAKEVWPTTGLSLTNMRQGPLGDCFFVSVVGAIVERDPKMIENMVTPIEGGKFRVAFPSTRPVIVGPLTDAQLAISSTTNGEGVWLAVLEQAFGRYRATTRPSLSEDTEMSDMIAKGGSVGPTITAMTGHPRKRIAFAASLEKRAERQSEILPILRKELIGAMHDHRLVATGVNTPPTTLPANGTPPKIPAGINTKHAYAILSYDAASDTIELWNPHGQLFKPKEPQGMANGYATEHGKFKVPLTEAYLFLSSVSFEIMPTPSTQPAKQVADAAGPAKHATR